MGVIHYWHNSLERISHSPEWAEFVREIFDIKLIALNGRNSLGAEFARERNLFDKKPIALNGRNSLGYTQKSYNFRIKNQTIEK
jgi:hypothetical protein